MRACPGAVAAGMSHGEAAAAEAAVAETVAAEAAVAEAAAAETVAAEAAVARVLTRARRHRALVRSRLSEEVGGA